MFTLRGYHADPATNRHVATLAPRTAPSGAVVHVATIDTGGGVYQIYPANASKTFFHPFPPLEQLFVMDATGQRLACISAHDQYVYFELAQLPSTVCVTMASSEQAARSNVQSILLVK